MEDTNAAENMEPTARLQARVPRSLALQVRAAATLRDEPTEVWIREALRKRLVVEQCLGGGSVAEAMARDAAAEGGHAAR